MSSLLLLAACAASAASPDTAIGCATGGVEVCLTGDSALATGIDQCLSGTTSIATGMLSLSAWLGTGRADGMPAIVSVGSVEATATCTGGTATLKVAAQATVQQRLDNVALEGTLLDVTLEVQAGAGGAGRTVSWSGELAGGRIGGGSGTGVTIGFTVAKEAGGAVGTTLYADIADLGELETLDLPSRLSYTEAGLPFFDESRIAAAATSCKFNALSGSPSVALPGVDALLQVTSAALDVCGYAMGQEGAEVLRLGAVATGDVGVRGLALQGLGAEVSGTYVGGALQWGGSLTATVSSALGGVTTQATADFSDSALEGVSLAVDVAQAGVVIAGHVQYVAEGCTAQNAGTVTATVAGVTVTGTLAQQDGCGADGTTAEWTLDVSTQDTVTVSGVAVEDVSVALQSSQGATVWGGTVRGGVALGGSTTAAAVVTFDGSSGVTAFDVQGAVSVGAVSGTVSLSVADGVMTGVGSLGFAGADSDSTLPAFTATVVHVATYTPENADLPLWSVAGSLSEFQTAGLALSGVTVALEGRLQGQDAAVAWTGTVSGTAAIGGTNTVLQANMENNRLTSLSGSLALGGGGVTFTGDIEVVRGEQNCATATGGGSLALTGTDATFTASLTYDACAVAVGATRYTLQGTAAQVSFQGLTLSGVTVELQGDVAAGNTIAWTGSLAASANLFGGSSQATVAFADGSLQSASLSTIFMTSNALLSGSLQMQYVNSCMQSSTGQATTTLRLKGADDLTFDAAVSYNKCTGAMALSGSVAGSWNGPGATRLTGLTVDLSSSGNGDETLSSRRWEGSITATTDAGLSAMVAVSTLGSESSVEATLTYADANTLLTATIGTDCTGSGMVALSNLPHGIPAVEVAVTFAKPCDGGSTKAWTATGALPQLAIPFFGKTLRLSGLAVTVSSSATGVKSVAIQGAFLSDFELELGFDLPVKAADVRLRGGALSGKAPSPDGFASAFQGGATPFGGSLGSATPGLLDGLKKVPLDSVALEVSFGGELSLSAAGQVFGMDFAVLVGVKKNGAAWDYGMSFSVEGNGIQGASGLPGVVKNALSALAPTTLRFSVAKAAMELQGTPLRQGLSLALFLNANSGPVSAVKAIAPAGLKAQIESAQSGGGSAAGLTVVADIVSATDMNVFVMLAGNIPLGSDKVTLREVSLAFALKATGLPEFGFNVVLDFTVGKGGNAKDFTAGGFISLSASGSLTVALSLSSPEPWSRPFGIPGVKVLFPLGIKMTVTPVLLPSQFALIGGVQVGGTTGTIAVGVDLQDFGNTAFKAEVLDLDIKRIITDVAQCNNCLGPVAGVVADMSLEKMSGSFNPDPANDVVIQIADVSATIPAGINMELLNLRLWSVVRIAEATFRVTATGISATLIADKIDWSVIQITSADGSSGPSFSLALTATDQHLHIDGAARILGKRVSLFVALSDSKVEGSFTYSLGSGFSVAVTMATTGRPGQAGFSNTITGALQADVVAQTVSDATAFLYALEREARSELADAKKDLDDAKADLDDAKKDLADAEAAATRKISSAQNKVNGLKNDLDNKKDSCKSKERRCRKKPWKCGSVATCWTEYAAIKTAKEAADAALTAVKKTVQGAVDAAKGTVDTAKGTVTATQTAFDAADGVVGTFNDIISAVGGQLKNALRIRSLTFSNTLSNSNVAIGFSLDMTVVGTRVRVDFSTTLSYSAIKNKVETEFRKRMKQAYGSSIKKL
eukprot:Rhum_TRINITY_DN22868_c0_g1::Rhum_TRINITY_DN22868_c0_g1_i1::g.176390::m.176390